ncbi:MAG: MATE family efflux transporter [Oligoflexia bacterium]|nr:MATE family efflux transporter [Oligoflexia bacterium]
MNKKNTSYFLDLVTLSLPIILGHIGHVLIQAGDVFIAGRHSSLLVAACGVASGFSSLVFIAGLGLLFGISPTLARYRGAGKNLNQYLPQTILYSVIISVVIVVIGKIQIHFIPSFNIDKNLVPLIQQYLDIFIWSFPPAFMATAIKEFLQAKEDVVFANTLSIITAIVNVILCAILVINLGGMVSSLGIEGLAIASVIARVLMVVVLMAYAFVKIKNIPITIDKEYLRDIFKLSVPIALAIFLEISTVSVISILIGRLEPIQSAAHSVVLTIATIIFMVPLGISSALAVKIGLSYGSKNQIDLINYIKSGILIVLTFMLFSAFSSYLFGKQLIMIFIEDHSTVLLALPLLGVMSLLQISDGIQVVLANIQRGMGVSKPSFYISLISYWLVALPIGHCLGVYYSYNALGYWIGLATGLTFAAIMLAFVLRYYLKQQKFA